jgi:hypothetical protein
MTRKELVDLLVANYAEDDEVYVRYLDDQGECVDKVKGVDDVIQTYCNGHYEVRGANGEWEKLKDGDSLWNYTTDNSRYVTDHKYDRTRKCIVV